MRTQLEYYFLLFFLSAVLGWCMEVVCKLIQFRRFINRGFLLGPYCPIYGFGAVLVTALLSRFSSDPLAVFGLAVLLCGTLEYLTSYLMEKLFHARWWDYSQKRFNLNGRVCLSTVIPFGLLGLGMVYGVKPVFFGWLSLLNHQTLDILCVSLLCLLLADTVVSTLVLTKIRATANLTQKDDTEAITKSVRELLGRESALARRTLRAFPYAKLYSSKLLSDLKAKRLALRTDIGRKRDALKNEINERDQALRKELQRLKEARKH